MDSMYIGTQAMKWRELVHSAMETFMFSGA